MSSLLYNSASDQEQSVANLVKIYSLIHLLEQDREQLVKLSSSICYYHPNIDRDRAEQLLRIKYINSRIDGLFLLRDCTTSLRDFGLSLICNDKCYHYKVELIYDIYFSIGRNKSFSSFYIFLSILDSGPQIGGIENIIKYYQEHPDGLICTLSHEFVQGQPPPNASRCIGSTNTLHRACKQGNFDIVKKILSTEYSIHRPDVNGKDSYGSTALHEASYFGDDDIVRLLIKAGSHVLARDINGASALHRVSKTIKK
jgi:hypothetical protein